MSEQWMSIVEYARRFAISDMTVRRRIRNGKLHAVLRDGKYYIPIRDLHGQHISALESAVDSKLTKEDYIVSKPQSPSIPITRPADVVSTDTRFPESMRVPETYMPSYNRKVVTEPIRSPFSDHSHAMMDSQAILRYCENSLLRFTAMEQSLKDSYEHKIHALEDRLKTKDLEISTLHQQLEDLQTLINMIDQPSKPK